MATSERAPPDREPFLSDDLWLLIRPFRGYSHAFGRAKPGFWTLVRGPLRWLLVIGLFVSLTTAGRLAWPHLVLPATVWAVFPVMQALWIVIAARVVGSRASPSVIVDLYFRGHGIWYLLLLAITGVCLLASDPELVLDAITSRSLLVPLFAVPLAISTFLTYAMLRGGLALGRLRSIAGVVLFTLTYGGGIVAWFALTGQLAPLVLEVPT